MGYSARYHAASLAAVFFALAVGILLGSQFGGDLLNSTRKDLEKSLTRDLDSARAEVRDLNRRADWSESFGKTVYPLLVEDRLQGLRIGLIGFGDLPGPVVDAVEQAIEPTGGRLVAVGTLRQPPDRDQIADLAGRNRSGGGNLAPGRFGRIFGRQLVTGGSLLDAAGETMMSQSSGRFGNLDGLIAFRGPDDDLTGPDRRLADRMDRTVLAGATGSKAKVVGVETLGTDPSGIGFFRERDLTTVDNADMPAGKVSLVYSLNGAVGDFGVKKGAGRLMPELLAPVAAGPGRQSRPGKRG